MTVIDLFAGPGGWDVAARTLGIDPIGLEFDDAACATRRAAGFATEQVDVAAIDPREALAAFNTNRHRQWQDGLNHGWYTAGEHPPPVPFTRPQQLQGLIASPPCQAFSSAGKQKGKADIPKIRRAAIQLAHGRDHRAEHDWADERAPLVLEPLRWALALRPEWMCWEQVPPVLPFWELCGKLLEQRGYSVWTGLLHAEQFGVPQTRKRAFLIASRVGAVAPPAPTHSKYYARDKGRLDDGVAKWVSMAEALGWGMTERPSVSVPASMNAAVLQGGSGTVRTIRAEIERGAWLCPTNVRPHSAMRAHDEPAPTMAFGHDSPRWVFDRPATTVNCDPRISAPGRHDPNESGSQQKGAIHVTPAEAATLQSFPDGFPWQGTRTKQFQQIGNAVPPGLARPVLEAALGAGALAVAA